MTCIGIDLGTTNSLVAVFEDNAPRLLPNALGEYLTPSVVGLADDGETYLTGRTAQRRLTRFPKQTKALFKRQMGSGSALELGRKTYSATDLSAMILSALKADAEAALGNPVREAVISVPAYFNAIQRQATKDAAEIAGLNVRRLINEPTAAALANGLLDREDESLFLVLDLGGGTFDVSILEMFEGVMEVRSSAGDAFLGGEDFTEAVARHFADEAGLSWKTQTAEQRETLLSFAERIKRALSESKVATASLELGGEEKEFSLTTEKFEHITSELLARLRRPIEKCLYDAGERAEAIERIVLVGGATRMPAVRSLASRIFKKLPERKIDPDHAIALGAAVQAGLIEKHEGLRDVVMTDVTPFSMGIESGTETENGRVEGIFSAIIERNTVLPVSRISHYSTAANNQKSIEVNVYQGEAAFARDNVLLSSFKVQVPPKPAGEETIEVRFTYDVSGLLAVDVKVLSTGREYAEVIENMAQAMSEDDKASRLSAMEALKVNPRDAEQNMALIESMKHMHEMLLGRDRHFILGLLTRFEDALAGQDTSIIEKERKEIATILAEIEDGYVR